MTFLGVGYDEASQRVGDLLYDRLYRPGPDLSMRPVLASGPPDVAPDGLTWTIDLRDDAVFHDGSPVTAADVAFTLELLRSSACAQDAGLCRFVREHLAVVRSDGPQKVLLTLTTPDASFLGSALGRAYILPKAAVQASFDRFERRVSGLSPNLLARIRLLGTSGDKERRPECFTDLPPDSCSSPFYWEDLGTMFEQLGLPIPRAPAGADDLDRGTVVRPLAAVDAYLRADAADRLAAALPALDLEAAPIGSGPYRFVAYRPGIEVELARNQAYFGGDVAPGRAVILIAPDSASVDRLVAADAVDWIPDYSFAALDDHGRLRQVEAASFAVNAIIFNVRPGHPYADVNLRRAFALCIDVDAAVREATDGKGVPVRSVIHPRSWAAEDLPARQRDVVEARRLIEASGWRVGRDGIYAKGRQRLETEVRVRQGRPNRVRFAILIAEQLRDCGMSIRIPGADFGSVLIPLGPLTFEAYLGTLALGDDPDPSAYLGSQHVVTEAASDETNLSGWSDPATDRLLADGLRETDLGKRQAVYSQLQDLIADQVPLLPLWSEPMPDFLTGDVRAADGTIDRNSPRYDWNVATWYVEP